MTAIQCTPGPWRIAATVAVMLACAAQAACSASRPGLELDYPDSLWPDVLMPMLQDSSVCRIRIEAAEAMLRDSEPGRLPQDDSRVQGGILLGAVGSALLRSPCLACCTATRSAALQNLVNKYRAAVLRYCHDSKANAVWRVYLLFACTNLYEDYGGIWPEGFRLLAAETIQPREGSSWEEEFIEARLGKQTPVVYFSNPGVRLSTAIQMDWRIDERFELAAALVCRERPDWEGELRRYEAGCFDWLDPRRLRRYALAPAEKALDEVLNQYAEKHDGRLPDRLWDESGPAESELIREWLDRRLSGGSSVTFACWFLGGWPGYRLVKYTMHGSEWFLTVEGVEPGQREVLMGRVRAR